MKIKAVLSLMLIGACNYVCAQSRNTPVDAGSLRGKRITNPLQPLDRQGLGWQTSDQKWLPTSFATQSGNVNFCAPTGGSSTTYTCNLTPALSAYGSGGLTVTFKPDVNNTGASTLNINSLGAKNIQKLSSGSLVSLSAGDLDSDAVYILRYNGTVFVVDPSSGTAAASGLFQSIITDLKPSATTTIITIAAGMCWGTYKSSAMTLTITGGSGNGSWVAYCTDSQTIVVEYSTSAGLTVTASGLVPIQVTTPTVTEGMYAVASGTISSGAWSTTVTDLRDFTKYVRMNAGTGMAITCSGGVCTFAVDTAVVQVKTDNYTPLARLDATGATSTAPVKSGTSAPGTCTVGDMFFDTDAAAGSNLLACTATNTWTTFAGSGYDPMDRTKAQMVEEFASGRLDTSASIGTYGWFMGSVAGSGSTSSQTASGDRYGIIRITTGTSTNDEQQIQLGSLVGRWDNIANWDFQFIIRIPTITSIRAVIGLLESFSGGATGNRIAISFDPSDNAAFRFRACAASVCSTDTSTVTVVANTWYLGRIRSTSAGTILFSINGESEKSITGGNVPTATTLLPVAAVRTDTTAARDFDLDWWAFQRTGLSR